MWPAATDATVTLLSHYTQNDQIQRLVEAYPNFTYVIDRPLKSSSKGRSTVVRQSLSTGRRKESRSKGWSSQVEGTGLKRESQDER